MFHNVSNLGVKTSKKYVCNLCDYVACQKSNYKRHIESKKHKNREMFHNVSKNEEKRVKKLWPCCCGKIYKYHQSYYRHKKNCKEKNKQDINESLNETVLKLITENKELRNIIIKQSEQISELIPKIGNNNISNTHNNHFNIMMFLNNKCKNAISMKDFIESITISMQDLDFTKNNGNVKGITKIISDNLSKLSLYKRPMHCYNKSNKVMFIKNKEWQQDKDYKEIKALISSIDSKQIKKLDKWTNENIDYLSSEVKSNEFIHLVNKTIINYPETREKIIKIICDKTLLQSHTIN